MGPMKRFPLKALLLVMVALCPGTTALARGSDGAIVQLTNTGVEPDAQGQTSLNRVSYLGSGLTSTFTFASYKGYLIVTCQGLAPGATYETTVGRFTADRNGKGIAKGWVGFSFIYWPEATEPDLDSFEVGVFRINPDGSRWAVLTGVYFGD